MKKIKNKISGSIREKVPFEQTDTKDKKNRNRMPNNKNKYISIEADKESIGTEDLSNIDNLNDESEYVDFRKKNNNDNISDGNLLNPEDEEQIVKQSPETDDATDKEQCFFSKDTIILDSEKIIMLKAHPLLDCYSCGSPSEYNSLKESIKTNGQQSPIIIDRSETHILDGRNLLKACIELKKIPYFYKLDVKQSDDEVILKFVESLQHRKNLSESQRAVSALLYMNYMSNGNKMKTKLQKQVCKLFNVGSKNVDSIKTIYNNDDTKVIFNLIKQGSLTINYSKGLNMLRLVHPELYNRYTEELQHLLTFTEIENQLGDSSYSETCKKIADNILFKYETELRRYDIELYKAYDISKKELVINKLKIKCEELGYNFNDMPNKVLKDENEEYEDFSVDLLKNGEEEVDNYLLNNSEENSNSIYLDEYDGLASTYEDDLCQKITLKIALEYLDELLLISREQSYTLHSIREFGLTDERIIEIDKITDKYLSVTTDLAEKYHIENLKYLIGDYNEIFE